MNPNQIQPQKNPREILFLTPRFPYPLFGGDRIKSYYILKYLSSIFKVTLVTFNHGAPPNAEQRKAIEELGIELYTIPLHPLQAGIRCIRTVIEPMPLEILFYLHPAFQKKVDDLCRQKQFVLGISFFMRTAEYLKNKQFPRVLIAEDCRTMYQTRSSQASNNILQKAVRSWEVMKLKQYEADIVNKFDLTTLVTHADIQAMQIQNPKAKYRLLSNGSDLDIIPASSRSQIIERTGLLFIGKLNTWANKMMARTIVQEILPLVHQEFPETQCIIAGASPDKDILSLAGPSVKIYQDVPDIEAFLINSAIFVHPHKGASGIQNKVLHAMAASCAVITTNTGIQGIPARHGIDVLIGNTPQEMADHICMLLRSNDMRADIALHARSLIEHQFSWPSIYRQMDDVLRELNLLSAHSAEG
jgi:glycosyltransferase involved in cell wall biosynthesis